MAQDPSALQCGLVRMPRGRPRGRPPGRSAAGSYPRLATPSSDGAVGRARGRSRNGTSVGRPRGRPCGLQALPSTVHIQDGTTDKTPSVQFIGSTATTNSLSGPASPQDDVIIVDPPPSNISPAKSAFIPPLPRTLDHRQNSSLSPSRTCSNTPTASPVKQNVVLVTPSSQQQRRAFSATVNASPVKQSVVPVTSPNQPHRNSVVPQQSASQDVVVIETLPRKSPSIVSPAKPTFGSPVNRAVGRGSPLRTPGELVRGSPVRTPCESNRGSSARTPGEPVRGSPVRTPGEPVRGSPARTPGEPVRVSPARVPGEPVRGSPMRTPGELVRGSPARIPGELVRGSPARIPGEPVRSSPVRTPGEPVRGSPVRTPNESLRRNSSSSSVLPVLDNSRTFCASSFSRASASNADEPDLIIVDPEPSPSPSTLNCERTSQTFTAQDVIVIDSSPPASPRNPDQSQRMEVQVTPKGSRDIVITPMKIQTVRTPNTPVSQSLRISNSCVLGAKVVNSASPRTHISPFRSNISPSANTNKFAVSPIQVVQTSPSVNAQLSGKSPVVSGTPLGKGVSISPRQVKQVSVSPSVLQRNSGTSYQPSNSSSSQERIRAVSPVRCSISVTPVVQDSSYAKARARLDSACSKSRRQLQSLFDSCKVNHPQSSEDNDDVVILDSPTSTSSSVLCLPSSSASCSSSSVTVTTASMRQRLRTNSGGSVTVISQKSPGKPLKQNVSSVSSNSKPFRSSNSDTSLKQDSSTHLEASSTVASKTQQTPSFTSQSAGSSQGQPNRQSNSSLAKLPVHSVPSEGSCSSRQSTQKRPSTNPTVEPAKKKEKIADRVLPFQIVELVPEANAYLDMLDLERKIDSTIMRKRLYIQECLKRPMNVKRKMRLFIQHSFTSTTPNVPSWELRLEGRLLNLSKDEPRRKFSTFFKSLVIELDKDLYGPDNHLVEWLRFPGVQETDGFQVKRPGDKDVRCVIRLSLDYQPVQFKLESQLAYLLGIHTQTRAAITAALWQYIKTNDLQDAKDNGIINCDKRLSKILGRTRLKFAELPHVLNPLLFPPDPIVINHTIAQGRSNISCYDIDVEVDSGVKTHMNNFMVSTDDNKDITALDSKICETVRRIKELKISRDFFLNFSKDPQQFISKWLTSQMRDLQTMTDVVGHPECERRAEFYYQPSFHESVWRYLHAQIQEKRKEVDLNIGVQKV